MRRIAGSSVSFLVFIFMVSARSGAAASSCISYPHIQRGTRTPDARRNNKRGFYDDKVAAEPPLCFNAINAFAIAFPPHKVRDSLNYLEAALSDTTPGLLGWFRRFRFGKAAGSTALE